MMIPRNRQLAEIRDALTQFPVVAIVGARQIGKSTLARELASGVETAHVFDLEDPRDLAILADASAVLRPLRGLVILDEMQQRPDLFPLLRVLADRRPLPARFLVLGSASPDLHRQSSESLAGRILYHHLTGLTLSEVGADDIESLWLRGGLPESFVATTETRSLRWRTQFIDTYLSRDLAALGYRAPPHTMRRFWTMLAHLHGQHLNISKLAEALGETHQATRRSLDALCSTYMVTQMLPWFANVGKRQVKAPKVYVGDSGILHALLGIAHHHDLLAHPVVGASWESFAMAQIQQRHMLHPHECYYWGLHSRAEVDMVARVGGQPVGYEFKVSSTPRTTKSMHSAVETLGLQKLYVVHPGTDPWPMGDRIEALGLAQQAIGS